MLALQIPLTSLVELSEVIETEMLDLHFVRECLADSDQIRYGSDRVELGNFRGIDVFKITLLEPRLRQFRVVARVRKLPAQIIRNRIGAIDEITNLAIDLRVAAFELLVILTTVYAATDDAAVDVLIDGGAVHQRAGKADEV